MRVCEGGGIFELAIRVYNWLQATARNIRIVESTDNNTDVDVLIIKIGEGFDVSHLTEV